MSQIDKIIYIPLLFWFIGLILLLYFIIFTLFLSTILTSMKLRVLYYKDLVSEVKLDNRQLFFVNYLLGLLYRNYNIYINYYNKRNKLK
jgi:hypothetical protein